MKPNKYLGQNFLTSKKIVEEIIKAASLDSKDTVLEVGPGTGFLTEELVKRAGRVIAVEKDERMIDYLKEKFANVKNLKIIHNDILKFKFHVLDYKVVANIPYYITSRFLRTFLENPPIGGQPSKMVLMVQKEVAERITSGKESILSISVKIYGQPKIIKKVSAKYFSPQPKVDSAILLIDNISKDFFRDINEKKFFELVKKGFSSKRKMLKNNLGLSNTECLTRCGISEKARAEDLSPESWKCLFKNIDK